jgi:hypothetical protein
LLDTLPKLGNHHFAQLGCHSSLKRELVGGLNHLRISGSTIFGLAALYSQSLFFSWIFNELPLIATYALAVGCY